MKKILVCLKRVVDYNVRIRIKTDGSGVATEGLKTSINPFDEIALEEAVRMKERGDAEEIVAVTIGTRESEQQLRAGLAMGADRALLIESEVQLEPLDTARALRSLLEREPFELVLMGKQSIDGDNNQTGQMLAALWDRPQATFASSIAIADGKATVAREVDAGLEVVEVALPAVITTDLRLNEPRYIKLPEILKAKKKPLDVISISELVTTVSDQFEVVRVEPPPVRQPGMRVDSVDALVAELELRGLIP